MPYEPPSEGTTPDPEDSIFAGLERTFRDSVAKLQREDPTAIPNMLAFYPIINDYVMNDRLGHYAELYAHAFDEASNSVLYYFAVGTDGIPFLDELVSDLENQGLGQIVSTREGENIINFQGRDVKLVGIQKP